jgi:AsmA-like C-terminal region
MKMPRWLRAVLIAAVVLVAAGAVFSRALRASAARRYLTAHLAASFGRPVDVSWFDFSLLDGARIEAHSVTVSEDPRFGNEYFLRSDTLTAGLRWGALLGGRFEFGSVSLSRPSLNLVRDAMGQWNIERWLPPAPPPGSRPGFVGPVAPLPEVRATRPARIDIQDGRINFKRGDDKVSFALVGVSGRIEQNGLGRWQLDLEALPMRAGVELQDIGTVRLRGSIAGTTARLQPAELALTWRAASLADTLRLLSENDYGMRGELAVDLSARISPSQAESAASSTANPLGAQWSISGVARLTRLHGWGLPERASDPAANLSVEMDWRLGEPRVQIRNFIVEMPASHLEGKGEVDWARGIRPELQIASSTVGLSDVLSCYRALRPDVAEDLQASGTLALDARFGGWPIELQEGGILSSVGTLIGTSLPAPLRIGELRASVSRRKIDVSPAEISFLPASAGTGSGAAQAAGAAKNAFVVRGSLFPSQNGVFRWPPNWDFAIEGATARAQDWLDLTRALAQPLNSGWTASGGVAMKMRGERRADSSAPPWIGTVDFLALTLNPSYVNQPLVFPKARIEFAPMQRTITLSAAEAFGTTWRGSIARKYSDEQWSFDLTADTLDAVELDRWLGPRARPGFLARMIGSDSGPSPARLAGAFVTKLAARGRLRAGAISVPPMHIEKFDGQAELDGRAIRIRGAQGDFFGGKISGSLDAQLVPDPSYEFQGRFDRVDLALLGRSVPSLNGRIAGIASATLTVSAHGIGRQDLIDSIEGQGTLNGRNVSLRGIDLLRAASGTEAGDLPDTFAALQGAYRIRNKSVDFVNFVLQSSEGKLQADGRVDFSHALNIRIHPSGLDAAPAPASDSLPSFLLGGTIEAPNLFLASAVPKPSARASSR